MLEEFIIEFNKLCFEINESVKQNALISNVDLDSFGEFISMCIRSDVNLNTMSNYSNLCDNIISYRKYRYMFDDNSQRRLAYIRIYDLISISDLNFS